jgi:hypothetical protein
VQDTTVYNSSRVCAGVVRWCKLVVVAGRQYREIRGVACLGGWWELNCRDKSDGLGKLRA